MNVIIIGRKSCGWCRKARQLCKTNGLAYTYRDLDKDRNKELKRYFEIEGYETVPQIFVAANGNSLHVGGYEEFERYLARRS